MYRGTHARIANTHGELALRALESMMHRARFPGQEYMAVAAMAEFHQQVKIAAGHAAAAVWPVKRWWQLRLRAWKEGK
jgi:hypothetical protein